MSDITINSLRQPAVGAEPAGVPPRQPQQAPAAPATPAATPTTGTDSVTLSTAAQATGRNAGTGTTLTESDANRAAVTLRQQLGAQSLSTTARQNQAILSLLR